jgi:ABC-type bacteriocin/lantibiotic exporter with double-glycine peptidase domain
MFGIGAIVRAVMYLIIVLVVVGGLWYIINIKADLATSEANNQKLQEATKLQSELIESMQKDIKQIQEINVKLQEENTKQKKDVDALSRKFDKRDFGAFVSANPAKAQELINRGTTNVMRCLELASGAPLNEKEKNAKSPTEANRECPSFIDSDYVSSN